MRFFFGGLVVSDLVPHGGTGWGQGALLNRQACLRSRRFLLFRFEFFNVEEADMVGIGLFIGIGEEFVFESHAVSSASHVEVFQLEKSLKVAADLHLAPAREVTHGG